MDATILLAARPETQLARLRRRDGLNERDALARMAAQMPLSEKRARATWVIENDDSLDDVRERLVVAWDELTGEILGPS